MKEEVTGVTEQSGLQIPAMPDQEGTQIQTAKPTEEQGVPPTSGDDLKNQLELLKGKYEQDISRLRQSLDRRYQQAETQWTQERDTLTRRLNEVVMSSMDEDDREAYELEVLREDRQRLAQQLEVERQRAEQAKAMYEYAKWFNELGVPYEKLNMESPEAMMESAWNGLRETVTDLRKKLSALETQQSAKAAEQQNVQNQQVVQRKQAPQTFTGKGTPPSTEDILLTVQKGLSEKYGRPVSLDETFNHIESGKVDINALLRSGG